MSFTPDELKKTIEETLNTKTVIPNGHNGAFVVYVDNSGARTAVAVKLGDTWEVRGSVTYHPHEDGLKYGLNLMASW